MKVVFDMEKVLSLVCVNVDGTIVSARDDKQPLAIRLPEKEGNRLLKSHGLGVVPYQKDVFYNFSGKEPLIKFSACRFSGKRVNGVAYFEADSFEFLESEMI